MSGSHVTELVFHNSSSLLAQLWNQIRKFGKRPRIVLGVSLVLIILLLVLVSTLDRMPNNSSSTTVPNNSSSSTAGKSAMGRRLGFWMQEADPMKTYTPLQFFNQYFLTPPYPSSLEIMIFGPLNPSPSEQNSIAYWSQVASLADRYPNIDIEAMVAFNMSSQVSDLKNYVNAFKSHPSIYSIGVEGEYATNQNLANMQSAMNMITASGKQFVNYYVSTSIVPNGGYIIGHTNFPGGDSGGSDQVGTLTLYQTSPYIGEDSGYYSRFSFPGSLTCPIGADASNRSTWQWNQCAVDTIINTSLTIPFQYRQFVNLVAGFPSPKFSIFKDTAGISTAQLWDNPTFRSWIWSNPSYSANFVLSTNGTSLSSSSPSSNSSTSSLSSGIIPPSSQIMSVVTSDMTISSI